MRSLCLTLLAMSGVAVAGPTTTTYQGRLLDPLGAPIDGDHSVGIRLYNDSGATVFDDTFDPVPFDNGYFSVVLGSDVPLTTDALIPGPVYVGIAIDGQDELPITPQLHSAPYAAVAQGVQLGNVDECDTGSAGTLRWTGSGLSVCNGQSWSAIRIGADGSLGAPAVSCAQLKLELPSTPSGTYYIDPNLGSASDAFPVYCQMDVDGGGWTRVATFSGSLPICSMAEALGTPEALATNEPTGHGTGDAWLAPATVESIPWSGAEVMIYMAPTQFERFTSTNPNWSWSNVADGTINTGTMTANAIQGRSSDQLSFIPLGNGAGCNAGSCLMGGYNGGTWNKTILGIGAYQRVSFTQDGCAAASSAYPGAWRGSWGQAASVYIR